MEVQASVTPYLRVFPRNGFASFVHEQDPQRKGKGKTPKHPWDRPRVEYLLEATSIEVHDADQHRARHADKH